MDTYQKLILSGSANGIGILVNAIVVGSANTIHTAHATNIDEVWLTCANYTANDVDLILSIGGTAAGQLIQLTIPAQRGFVPVLSGLSFTGGVIVKAHASVTASLAIYGFVNRIVTI